WSCEHVQDWKDVFWAECERFLVIIFSYRTPIFAVPPKLNPFHSSILSLNVGDRASITCSVIKGDIPLTITWRKDGRPIDPTQRMSVTQVDQYNSILLIENLSADHTGNYSCVVRNTAAETEGHQSLLVNVPPNIEPFSFQDGLAEGMRTRTVCGVSKGDPPLTLKWLKDGDPLLSTLLGANVSTLDQYSSLLNIPSLSAAHSGDYTCVASNPAAEVKFTASLQSNTSNANWLEMVLGWNLWQRVCLENFGQ
uniref:Ig-like domain-containing protein n=1 Tax=Anopheles maculatus TaxID=74869 RepID=A0A182TBL3_9DIPT